VSCWFIEMSEHRQTITCQIHAFTDVKVIFMNTISTATVTTFTVFYNLNMYSFWPNFWVNMIS